MRATWTPKSRRLRRRRRCGSWWPAWLLAWQEEIFADIYSALVAGPVLRFGLQQIIQTGMRASLVNDDGDHPLDALRPEILHATLRHGGTGTGGTAQAVDSGRRLSRPALAGNPGRARAPVAFVPAGEREALPLAEAGARCAALLRRRLAASWRRLPPTRITCRGARGGGRAHQEAVLYAQFDATCTCCRSRPARACPARPRQGALGRGISGRRPRRQRAVGGIGDVYLDEVRAAGIGGAALTAAEWKAVFLAGDWVTEEGQRDYARGAPCSARRHHYLSVSWRLSTALSRRRSPAPIGSALAGAGRRVRAPVNGSGCCH
ncbi:MAG: hypothetical protein H6640_23525 [Caldilineaceae bacterium]|nr:hypothetical protein [Caldilineaceae bacterium]